MIYIILGKIFFFILLMAGWSLICYTIGLWLLHRDYLKDKVARFILKHIYKENI